MTSQKIVEHFASGVKAIAADLDKFLSAEERVGLKLADRTPDSKQGSKRSGQAAGELRTALLGTRYR